MEHVLDAGKEVRSLDLRTPEGFEELVSLTAACGLFVEDRAAQGWFEGGPLATRLLERHPKLLAVCLSPFGMTGPYSAHAAYPLNNYHSGGTAQQIPCDALHPEFEERPPLQAGGQWGEAQCGTLAAVAALACMLAPDRGAGQIIDCSKQEALISFNWTEAVRYANQKRSPSRLAPLATIVGGILPARDGFVEVAVREDHQWAALAELLEKSEWIDDPRYATRAARMGRWREVSAVVAAETARFDMRHLHFRGREAGIPIAAVMTATELLRDEDLHRRGAWPSAAANLDGRTLQMPGWDTSVRSPKTDGVGGVGSPGNAAAAGAADGTGSAGDTGETRDTWDTDSDVKPAPTPRLAALPGKPLNGLRVLDLGWVAMGPYAGYALACLGAEVIHVGRLPDSDTKGVDLSAFNYGFDTLNTGKRWIGVDLKTPDGVQLVHELAAHVDIVLDNFRPGVTQRLGIDYSTLSKINPRLVVTSASTYGAERIDGPYVGYAPVFSALAGLADLTGYADGPPSEVSHPVDFFAGSVGVLGILAGLHRLASTGEGCFIDLSAREAILWSLSDALAAAQTHDDSSGRIGNGHRRIAPHGVYRCRGENRWISIAAATDAEWQALCRCMSETSGDNTDTSRDLMSDPRFDTLAHRLVNRAQLDQAINAWTREQELWPLFDRLQSHGVAAYPSATSQDFHGNRHLAARQAFLSTPSDKGPKWYAAPPWAWHGQARQALETVTGDEALHHVLSGVMGMTAAGIDSLKARRIVAARHP